MPISSGSKLEGWGVLLLPTAQLPLRPLDSYFVNAEYDSQVNVAFATPGAGKALCPLPVGLQRPLSRLGRFPHRVARIPSSERGGGREAQRTPFLFKGRQGPTLRLAFGGAGFHDPRFPLAPQLGTD